MSIIVDRKVLRVVGHIYTNQSLVNKHILYRSIGRRRLYYRRNQETLFVLMFSLLLSLSALIRDFYFQVSHHEGAHIKPLQRSFSDRRLMLQFSGVIPSLIGTVKFIALFSINDIHVT